MGETGHGGVRRVPARFSGTKFCPPALSTSFVSRPDLLDHLDAGSDAAFRLVTGPPGSGKTSLLTDWCGRRPDADVAWCTADSANADPVRFWRAVIEAVRQVVPGFAEETVDLLTLDGSVEGDALETLLEADAHLTRGIDLVIDDFHLVAPDVQEHLVFLSTRGLANLRLTIGSRTQPTLAMAGTRLRGARCEITDRELRLDRSATSGLLHRLGVTLNDDDLAVLWDRTSGWAAGVQLAGVALRDSDAPALFISGLHGTSNAVSDYLAYEFLDAQPPDIQRFLLDTCVVDELTPDLARALSPETGVTLREVEAANLLLTRVDEDGTAFRFHQLLLEMLRARLETRTITERRNVHLRAADYFEARGNVALAFRHRWRAGDQIEAIGLMTRVSLDEMLNGSGTAVADEALTLSDSDIRAAPSAAVAYVTALGSEGEIDAADRLAARVQRLVGDRMTATDRIRFFGARTAVAAVACDTAAVLEYGCRAVTAAAKAGTTDEYADLSIALMLRGLAWDGRFAEGDAIVEAEGRRLAGSSEFAVSTALLRLRQGRLGAAEHLASEALRAVRDQAGRHDNPMSEIAARTVLGSILLEQGHVDEAEEHLWAVSDVDSRRRLPMTYLARLGLARILWASGRFEAAFVKLDRARALVERPLRPNTLQHHLHALEARIFVDAGEFERAEGLIDALAPGLDWGLLVSRLERSRGRYDLAAKALKDLEPTAPAESLRVALAAIALNKATGSDCADIVERALDLSESTGAVFAVAEAGADVLAAVCQAARRRPQSPHMARLLSTRAHAVPEARASIEFAMDALTERERTVLRYMVTSMSYREIADELFVSVNTVKTHVRHIMSKLHAESRAGAVQRARDLRYI